ncbi:TBC1 domain family member 2A [Achlya hypogyna]|uniref:TBC1 domain family member 2A n=1 Tax=Achlya hypogyna TaxID=1202772 RepID=A0A1V9Z1X7_ACHHY|nr:TBC1 domain family member 2A [Achlya hypogyna]
MHPLDAGRAAGLTDSSRPPAWTTALAEHADRIRRRSDHSYYEYLAGGVAGDAAVEIAKDLSRTNLPLQRCHEAQLGRILGAYATRNPNVGYCQGMNCIGALLVLHVQDEDAAFWALALVLEQIFPGYHSTAMTGLVADQAVLMTHLAHYFPQVSARLASLEIEAHAFSTKWLVGAFAGALPLAVVVRLWDSIILRLGGQHGAADAACVLFGTVFALISLVATDVEVQNDAGSALLLLQSTPSHIGSTETFLAAAFGWIGALCPYEVSLQRDSYFLDAAAEAEARDRLRGSARWSVALHESPPTPEAKWRFSKAPRTLEYDVAFAPGALGLLLVEGKTTGLPTVYGFASNDCLGKRCNMVRKGDVVISVNGLPCTGHTLHEVLVSILL